MSGNTILIIDDDDTLRTSMVFLLERSGYKIYSAGDGKEGLKVIAQTPLDLVITDIVMPEMEGIELIMHLREKQPDLPILAISGGGKLPAGQYLNVAHALGACRILEKPFLHQQLIEAIHACLDTP